jgi:hypothetical protein
MRYPGKAPAPSLARPRRRCLVQGHCDINTALLPTNAPLLLYSSPISNAHVRKAALGVLLHRSLLLGFDLLPLWFVRGFVSPPLPDPVLLLIIIFYS